MSDLSSLARRLTDECEEELQGMLPEDYSFSASDFPLCDLDDDHIQYSPFVTRSGQIIDWVQKRRDELLECIMDREDKKLGLFIDGVWQAEAFAKYLEKDERFLQRVGASLRIIPGIPVRYESLANVRVGGGMAQRDLYVDAGQMQFTSGGEKQKSEFNFDKALHGVAPKLGRVLGQYLGVKRPVDIQIFQEVRSQAPLSISAVQAWETRLFCNWRGPWTGDMISASWREWCKSVTGKDLNQSVTRHIVGKFFIDFLSDLSKGIEMPTNALEAVQANHSPYTRFHYYARNPQDLGKYPELRKSLITCSRAWQTCLGLYPLDDLEADGVILPENIRTFCKSMATIA